MMDGNCFNCTLKSTERTLCYIVNQCQGCDNIVITRLVVKIFLIHSLKVSCYLSEKYQNLIRH